MKLKKMYRALSVGDIQSDEDKKSITFSFSSEYPVERYFGEEILSHDDGAPDLSRLNDGAALLWNHNTDKQIGVVDNAEIRGKKGYATVRFGSSKDAQEIYSDVKSGIIRNVSFGYQILEMNQTGTKDAPKFIATRWAPYEISLVSVPADPTIGIGRSDADVENEVKINKEGNEMKKPVEEQKPVEEAKPAEEAKPSPVVSIEEVKKESALIERARVSAILALGEQHGVSELARQLVDGGKTIEEARNAVLETIKGGQKPVTEKGSDIGLTEKEIRNYSFVKAINALANPNDKRAQEAAKFEIEASEAAAQKAGKAARGLMIPVDILREKRDLVVGTSTAGGHTVATDLMAGSFIELLRKKSIVQAAGATVMNGLSSNVAIPRHTGAGSAYWVAESGAPTESTQSFDQVTMAPKTLGAYSDYSRKLLIQSSIDVENFIKNDLAKVIALEIDRAALYGLGSSNQPQGLKVGLNGYNSASQELDLAGATPTFAEIVSLETKVSSLDAEAPGMKYLCNASMVGALKSAVKVSGYPVYILENMAMNGYPVLSSNQIASGDVWFGDWSQLIIGFFSGLDLMVDPYAGATSGTVRIVALQDCDIAARHYDAFARGNNTL